MSGPVLAKVELQIETLEDSTWPSFPRLVLYSAFHWKAAGCSRRVDCGRELELVDTWPARPWPEMQSLPAGAVPVKTEEKQDHDKPKGANGGCRRSCVSGSGCSGKRAARSLSLD